MKQPSPFMLALSGLFLLGAVIAFYHLSSELSAQSYILVGVGKGGNRQLAAIPGAYGWMLAVAAPLALSAFALFGLRKVQLAIICGAISCVLLASSSFGNIYCVRDTNASQPRCDLKAPKISYRIAGEQKAGFSFLRVGSLCLALYGLAAGVHALARLRNARSSVAWPKARGEIIESRVTRYSLQRFQWHWTIRYRYLVGATWYEGNRAFFGGNIPIGVARAIVAKFPVNSMAEVFYDPERHRKSVLLAGANKYTYYPLLAAPAYWLAAFTLWYLTQQ
ncbi:MAG: hypothetical protein JWP34_3924 [Massilia sp.]|nr:hypothetical protein [Massilia sp.]